MKLVKPSKKTERFAKINMLMISLLAGTYRECAGDYLKCPGVYDDCPGRFTSC